MGSICRFNLSPVIIFHTFTIDSGSTLCPCTFSIYALLGNTGFHFDTELSASDATLYSIATAQIDLKPVGCFRQNESGNYILIIETLELQRGNVLQQETHESVFL